MKKAEQERINNYIMKSLDTFHAKGAQNHFNYDEIRLHHCSAYVYETEDYYVLRSYSIIVAFIVKKNGDFINFFRYVCANDLKSKEYKGATTTQHIRKFCRDYQASVNNVYNYYPV